MPEEVSMTKEEIYDAQVAPLMTLIIAVCRRGNIDFVASFALDEDAEGAPLMCSTAIIGEDSVPGSSPLLQKMQSAIAESMAPPVLAFTISPATVTPAAGPGHGDS